MVLRRPYAFLIKYFRLIHLVIAALLLFTVLKYRNIYAYLNSVTAPISAGSVYSVKFYKKDRQQDYTYTGATGQTSIITVTY